MIKLTAKQIGIIECDEWTNPELHANYEDADDKRAWLGFMSAYDEESQALNLSDTAVCEHAITFVGNRLDVADAENLYHDTKSLNALYSSMIRYDQKRREAT